jgi:hypothetical protein
MHRIVLGLTVVAFAPCGAQTAPRTPVRQSELALDSLLASPGPKWASARSDRFVVYVERTSRHSPSAMLDSLEAAWTRATTLLASPVASQPRIPVLVTASRTRFPRVILPQNKGLTMHGPHGGDVLILVVNDSVRMYARHEVMHAVSRRAWGMGARGTEWMTEGLATFADDRCQGTTIVPVARDLLREQPALRAEDVAARFNEMARTERGRAYVLAGSLIGYLWESRGREGVRGLWQGTDSLRQPSTFRPFDPDLTTAWRAHVNRAAGASPGIDAAAFRRFACG